MANSLKQNIVSQSSIEAEYQAVAHTIYELRWLNNLLTELGFELKCHAYTL